MREHKIKKRIEKKEKLNALVGFTFRKMVHHTGLRGARSKRTRSLKGDQHRRTAGWFYLDPSES